MRQFEAISSELAEISEKMQRLCLIRGTTTYMNFWNIQWRDLRMKKKVKYLHYDEEEKKDDSLSQSNSMYSDLVEGADDEVHTEPSETVTELSTDLSIRMNPVVRKSGRPKIDRAKTVAHERRNSVTGADPLHLPISIGTGLGSSWQNEL